MKSGFLSALASMGTADGVRRALELCASSSILQPSSWKLSEDYFGRDIFALVALMPCQFGLRDDGCRLVNDCRIPNGPTRMRGE
jgi:hypothetical protein